MHEESWSYKISYHTMLTDFKYLFFFLLLVENPDVPLFIKSTLIGQSVDMVEYKLEWSHPKDIFSDIQYYMLQVISFQTSEKYISSLENSTVVSIATGMQSNVTIIAVNKCGKNSQSSILLLSAVKTQMDTSHYFLSKEKTMNIILYTLLSAVFVILLNTLIIIIIMLICKVS